MPRIVWILTLAQALSTSVAPLLVFAGGIVGNQLSPSPELATLPLAFMILGTAVIVMPMTRLMQYWGRKKVFVLGTFSAISGSLLAAWSVYLQNFMLFCSASALIGISMAAAQQYRFAAMEVVPIEHAGNAASRVLLGGLIAAFLGPELVVYGEQTLALIAPTLAQNPQNAFTGAFILLSLVCSLASVLILTCYQDHKVAVKNNSPANTPLHTILANPLIWLAIGASAIGYAMMSFMMTATPLNMHHVVGHSLYDTKWVIQSHIMAMFLPSFFSGKLIEWLGHKKLILAGLAAYLICIAIAYSGHDLMHYWWALVLLGIGWNFLFVGGTALLPLCHHEDDKFKVQSFNELGVFGLQAIAALSAGWVTNTYGWNALLTGCLLMVAMLAAIIGINRRHKSV